MEPLAVAMLWNQKDNEDVGTYVEYVTKMLSSDENNPFSRTINLPLFYYKNKGEEDAPPEMQVQAERVIVFAFLSKKLVYKDNWKTYIKNIQQKFTLVPIALDECVLNSALVDSHINFIRAYEMKNKKQQLFIALAHAIYRYGFRDKTDIGKDSAIQVFLSHTKEGGIGIELAKCLKGMMDNSTTMKNFFDATDIMQGDRFDDEIINNIKKSSIVLINSDRYSTKYWCQREVQEAKNQARPIIEVDLVEEGMDRKLPYAGNVPVVRVNLDKTESDSTEKVIFEDTDLYRILENILLETIRYNYVKEKLNIFKKDINGNTKCFCRPPEMYDLQKILQRKDDTIRIDCDKIIYPDPPVFSEEIAYFEKLGIEVFTPIEYQKGSMFGKKIGISISDPEDDVLHQEGLIQKHLEWLSRSMANYILGKGATLVYGGDLRENGFTQQLIEEAMIIQTRLKSEDVFLKNYLAWPIYLKKDEMEWIYHCSKVLKMVEVEMDTGQDKNWLNKNEYIKRNTARNCYLWGRSLTRMREKMIGACDARICVGGKTKEYQGKMPGVLEEILIANEQNCPIYLLGGFGGVVHIVCEFLEGKIDIDCLKKQCKGGSLEYKQLLEKYGEHVDYAKIESQLKNINLNTNGLSKEENRILFTTKYVDEAVQLVMKGLMNLKKETKLHET